MARIEYSSVADVNLGAWVKRWPHIDPAREWACKGTGRIVVDTDFLDLFEQFRAMFGKPLVITSGYRSPEYNQIVSTTGLAGPHTKARAMDIRIYGHHAAELEQLAWALGYTGLGRNQKGPHRSRFLHFDNLPNAPGQPRPWVWSY
jgi:uncharacterized protein YcbK (DUF882 family)